jgi:recombination protein RecR
MFSPLVQKLIDSLRYLPGVGPKSAQRMAFELLSDKSQKKGLELSNILASAIEQVGKCNRCNTYTEERLCALCKNTKRHADTLCIVESPADIVAIESANMFNGLYFVLHGHLSPLDGIGPQEINMPHLFKRIQSENIEEIILATNATMEGKATASYIVSQIDLKRTKCTRIAHGVPLGGELEYLDSGTLTHAFYSRVQME